MAKTFRKEKTDFRDRETDRRKERREDARYLYELEHRIDGDEWSESDEDINMLLDALEEDRPIRH